MIGAIFPNDAAVTVADDLTAVCKGSGGPHSAVLRFSKYPVGAGIKTLLKTLWSRSLAVSVGYFNAVDMEKPRFHPSPAIHALKIVAAAQEWNALHCAEQILWRAQAVRGQIYTPGKTCLCVRLKGYGRSADSAAPSVPDAERMSTSASSTTTMFFVS